MTTGSSLVADFVAEPVEGAVARETRVDIDSGCDDPRIKSALLVGPDGIDTIEAPAAVRPLPPQSAMSLEENVLLAETMGQHEDFGLWRLGDPGLRWSGRPSSGRKDGLPGPIS